MTFNQLYKEAVFNKLFIERKAEKLCESNSSKDLGNIFDNYYKLDSKVEQKFLNDNNNDFDSILQAARDGDSTAKIYLIKSCKNRLLKVFWVNFLGKSANGKIIRARIANGDFEDFLGIVYDAFDKAINSFDESRYVDGTDKLHSFQYWMGQYAKNDSIASNVASNKDLINRSIHPDSMSGDSDDENNTSDRQWDKLTAGLSEKNTIEEEDAFLSQWKKAAQDPEWKGKYPWGKILKYLLKGNSVADTATKFGCSKNTIRNKIFTIDDTPGMLERILTKYELTIDDFRDAVNKYGFDTILSELK